MPEDVPVPGRSFPSSWLEQRLAALSDARLTLLVALVLFALAAWPLLLVELPPFQDLPNHVATAHIIAHPDLYPQYVFNGLFKSNCAAHALVLACWAATACSGRRAPSSRSSWP